MFSHIFKTFVVSLFSLGLLAISLSPVPAHAEQNLGQVFNFFGVNCLVPDSSNLTDQNIFGAQRKIRTCKDGGISLLDQAVDFLYTLGPILAVIVIMWGGYLYYNSVFDGSDKRAMETVRAGVIGLAIIMSVPIIYSIFLDLSGATSSSDSLFSKLASTIVGNIIKPIANAGIVMGAAAAVISFIFAGYQYLMGDAKKGQEALRNAFIGLIVVLASVAIVALIQLLSNFVFK